MSVVITKLATTVRKLVRAGYGDASEMPMHLTPGGELITTQGLPYKTELVRQGNSWACTIATGSAFVPVAAMPTTLTNLELYNGEPAGGKSYIIDTISTMNLTSEAEAGSITVVAQLIVVPSAAATDDANQLITSLSGKPTYAGFAKRQAAGTKATANKWVILGSGNHYPATAIGGGVTVDCKGLFIVRPGMTFGINAVFGKAAGTAIQGITWHEVQLENQ
jgi:hypothetical protein